MGIVIGGAVPPIYMCLTWSKANASGAISGSIAGLVFGELSRSQSLLRMAPRALQRLGGGLL